MTVTDADLAALRAFPALRRLLYLRESGDWLFQPVLADDELALVAGARVWPGGWSDAIAIRDAADAKGFRCDPAGGVVWNREGSVTEVLDGLRGATGPAPAKRSTARQSARAVNSAVKRQAVSCNPTRRQTRRARICCSSTGRRPRPSLAVLGSPNHFEFASGGIRDRRSKLEVRTPHGVPACLPCGGQSPGRPRRSVTDVRHVL